MKFSILTSMKVHQSSHFSKRYSTGCIPSAKSLGLSWCLHIGEQCHWQAQFFSVSGDSVYRHEELLLHILVLLSMVGRLRNAGVHSTLALLDIQDPAVPDYVSNRHLNMQGWTNTSYPTQTPADMEKVNHSSIKHYKFFLLDGNG